MNDGGVSVEMFKIWATSQSEMMSALTLEMKGIRIEQGKTTVELKETNSLLRADINTTKAILNQHITEYNDNKIEINKRLSSVFKEIGVLVATLKSREGVYTVAKYIKFVLGIMLVGGLTASGAHLYDKYFIKEPKLLVKKEVKLND